MRLARTCAASLFMLALGGTWPGPAPVRAAGEPELVASTPHRTPEEERKGFHLPPGFEIQLVAAEPDIHKPMNIAFDDRGRLWVTSTIEYPFPAKEGTKARDALLVLEDFKPDGRAGKVTTFTDGLNIPIGVLPLSGGSEVLVHSIPNIRRFVDKDGDGKADSSEIAYSEYGWRDTHGMTNAFTWGFDGWIYACHGFSNTSTVKGADAASITMNSGNSYRMKSDGSHLEYFTHGQVNPFGLCFDPRGNLYSADCHSKPVYQLLRGAYYPSFGKPDDGLGFGPEMVSHDHGSTAISGVVYYAAQQFPAAWRDTVFIGNVVTNRINHDRIDWHGSSPVGVLQPDFLTSDDPWFRPVDLELGPDGALYIADFYNRIIGHYEVPLLHPGRDRESGRIWRVVYRGNEPHEQAQMPRADWTKAGVADLVEDLAHPNLTVRTKASNQLVERGKEAVEAVRRALQSPTNAAQRVHSLWVLHRLDALEDKALAAGAHDGDAVVRVHAMRILAERREMPDPHRDLALEGLKDPDPHVRRNAADAIGQHPASRDIRPLLSLRHGVDASDTHLLHVVRISLRDHLKSAGEWSRLPDDMTEADRRAIADVATGVPSAEAAAFLLQHVRKYSEQRPMLVRYVQHIARYGTGDSAETLLSFARADRPEDLGHQAALLKAIVQGTQERGGSLSEAASGWALDLTRKLVASSQAQESQAGFELAGSLKLAALRDTLIEVASSRQSGDARRVGAVNALVAVDPAGSIGLLGRILSDASEPKTVRELAANTLGRINQPEAYQQLLKGLQAAPGPLQATIAIGLAGNRSAAELLLDAVASGKASGLLLQEAPVKLRLAQAGIPDLSTRIDRLTAGLQPADQRLLELFNRRKAGLASAKTDATAGAKVFEKTCAVCHQIGGKGAKLGPQLDGVGIRGTDRLLEDILDPNRNVDLNFRATTLALSDGQVVTGLLLREEGAILVVADAQGKEVRIPKDTVEERTVTALSPMPANMTDQIPESDFYHLLSYLLSQQPSQSPQEAKSKGP